MADVENADIHTSVHELGGHWLFDAGLDAYRDLVDRHRELSVDDRDSCPLVGETFDALGDRWLLHYDTDDDSGSIVNNNGCSRWTGRIAPPDTLVDTSPDEGALVTDGGGLPEVSISVQTADDVGRRHASFQCRPAVPDAEHVDGGRLGMPADVPPGLRVQVQSANLAPGELARLFQALCDWLGVPAVAERFSREQLHEYSTVTQFATYVRLDRDVSEEYITDLDALLVRLAQFARTKDGRGAYEWDHRTHDGYLDTVPLDTDALNHLYDGHTVAKRLKSYLMALPDRQGDHETAHPKLEVQWVKRDDWDVPRSVPWQAVDALHAELDEYLVNALDWAGLPTSPGGDTAADDAPSFDDAYVGDAYFDAVPRPPDGDRTIPTSPVHHDDPIADALEDRCNEATAAMAADAMTPARTRVLEAAVAQPGTVPDVAERAGVSERTVRRVREEFPELFADERGRLSIADTAIRERLQAIIEGVRERIDAAAVQVRRLGQQLQTSIPDDSPFAQWIRKYAVDVSEDHSGQLLLELDTGSLTRAKAVEIIRDGGLAARQTSSRLFHRLTDALVRYRDRDDGRRTAPAFIWDATGYRALGEVTVPPP